MDKVIGFDIDYKNTVACTTRHDSPGSGVGVKVDFWTARTGPSVGAGARNRHPRRAQVSKPYSGK